MPVAERPDPLQEQATAKRSNPNYEAANAEIHAVVHIVQHKYGLSLNSEILLPYALSYTFLQSEELIRCNPNIKRVLQSAIRQGRYEDVMSLRTYLRDSVRRLSRSLSPLLAIRQREHDTPD